MSSLPQSQLDAIDPGDDADDIRDEAEELVDAAWEMAKVVDWLEPKESRKALAEVGDLLLQRAALTLVGAAVNPENWRALARQARRWLDRFEESSPAELRKKAAKKRERAAKALARGNQTRHDRLTAEAARLEADAKLAEARRGNG